MKRLLTIAIGLLLILAGVFLFKNLSVKKDKEKEKIGKNTEKGIGKIIPSVQVEVVSNNEVSIQIEANGSLFAKRRVELYAEVHGIMKRGRREFKPGISYNKGDILVGINGAEFYASLQAQKSSFLSLITSIIPDLRLDFPESFANWDQYVKSFDLNETVRKLPKPASTKEKLFISGKNIYTSYYNVKNMEVKWAKYNLRAPFNGTVTEALVNPGTLIRQGQKIGEFVDPSAYELEVSLSPSIANVLSIADEVVVKSLTSNESWSGKVGRVNARIDQTSQTAKAYIDIKSKTLKEGQYLTALIDIAPIENAYRLKRNLLIDGNKVYVVENGKLKLKEIVVRHYDKETVVVTGLPENSQLVSSAIPGLYANMEVKVLGQKR